MTANEGGKEVVYIRAILQDFGFTQKGPTNLYEDNLAAVAMSINPVRRKYSRYIDIHRHYVRELALAGLIKLIPLGTYDMTHTHRDNPLSRIMCAPITPPVTCHTMKI